MNVVAVTRICKNLLFALLPLCVFLLVIEIGVRSLQIDVSSTNRNFTVNHDIDLPEIYYLDSELFWTFRPGQDVSSPQLGGTSYHINAMGLRGEEPDKSAQSRILALGNSCTFGWSVREQYIWTHQLEMYLQDGLTGHTYEVINAGIPGYSSHQGRLFAPRLLELFRPQIVLIMFGWNDHWTAGESGTDSEIKMSYPFTLAILNTLATYKSFQLARELFDPSAGPDSQITINTIEGPRRVPPGEFRSNLGTIIDSVKSRGAIPLLLVPPIAPPAVTTAALQQLHGQYQQIIRDVGVERHVRVVDFQVIFDSTANMFTAQNDPVHFGVEGHQLVAQTLARELKSLLSQRN